MYLIKKLLILLVLLISHQSYSQIEFGYVLGTDFYQRIKNPADELASPSAGNVLLNYFLGPKVWIGGPDFSLSLEGQANIGFTTLSIKDYKGLGSVSFPLMAKLNFGGMTGMDREFDLAFALGGGVQYSKSELFYLSKSYKDKGVIRALNPTYIIEAALGYGGFGLDGGLYVRYGFHPDNEARI